MFSVKQRLIFLGAVITLIVDRFFKYIATQGWFKTPYSLIEEILNLHTVKNINIAFSIPFSGILLNITITALLLLIIGYMIWAVKNNKADLALWLSILIFGAVSNLFDRYTVKGVIDYLDLKYFTVFNLADIMIIIGILGIFWLFYKENKSINNA
jgi:signal peptidase II